MSIISIIISLFGCSKQAKENSGRLSDEIKEQVDKSIEKFKSRPIYRELTAQIIDAISDDNLVLSIFEYQELYQSENIPQILVKYIRKNKEVFRRLA